MVSENPDKSYLCRRFGICFDHICYDNTIEFTYLTGVQVDATIDEGKRPATTMLHEISTGTYARIQVSAPNDDTAIGTSYMELTKWLNESIEWEQMPGVECEVYPKEGTDAIMELWRPIKKKDIHL